MTSKVNCNRSNANELRASLKHVPSALLSPIPALLFHLQIRRKWGFHIKANWPPSPTVTYSPPLLRMDAANATRSCCLLFLCPWWSSFSRFGTVNSFSCDSCCNSCVDADLYEYNLDVYRFRKLIVSCPVLRSMQFVYNRATKFQQQQQEQVEKPEGHIVPQCEFLC